MDLKEYSGNSLSFIGDAVFTLHVREYFVDRHYQSPSKLQRLCNGYNSAKGQTKIFYRLKEEGFFTEEELDEYLAKIRAMHDEMCQEYWKFSSGGETTSVISRKTGTGRRTNALRDSRRSAAICI